MIEPSMCGGDAVFLSNYFGHLLALYYDTRYYGKFERNFSS